MHWFNLITWIFVSRFTSTIRSDIGQKLDQLVLSVPGFGIMEIKAKRESGFKNC